MKTIKVIIERSKDAFWAYSENTMVNGVGDTKILPLHFLEKRALDES